MPLRTLDALQPAVALWLREQPQLDHFLCADTTLCEAARQEGLSVMNPEMPEPLCLGRILFFSNP
ncbi:MAG TPA: hypothetical protein VNN62_24620 [Methylomirabilota bacterium]|nr:hypothetical protein [Methylomirabilota bacterium]